MKTYASVGVLVATLAAFDAASAQAPCAARSAIMQIQGSGHLSPCAGQTVTTQGLVTAIAFNGLYMQDQVGDANEVTSDGVFVFTGRRPLVNVGDSIRVTGLVSEFIPGGAATGNLSTTQIGRSSIEIVSSGAALPAPVVLGREGRVPPNRVVISSDETPVDLQRTEPSLFDPDTDGIDFYESLEGMRVTVSEPVAVSPTRTFSPVSSELFTLPDRGRLIAPRNARTRRGGISLQPDPENRGDQNPERVQIQFDAMLFPAQVPAIKVSDELADVTGVVGYSFGNFEVNATEAIFVKPKRLRREETVLAATPKLATVASYNVLNLSAQASDDAQRSRLATQIVENLRAPDVIALQEIQDNNGDVADGNPGPDGVVQADQTLQALVNAVAAAGGPLYAFFDVPPEEGTSGGIPGGNIRNAFLYNPERVSRVNFVSLTPDVLTAAGASNANAFEDSRNPLAASFSFNGRGFTVINNHLSSRAGSTPIFGAIHPFIQAAEAAREAQVDALHDYVASVLARQPAAQVMVLGDLNTFEFTDDLRQILPGEDRILSNLIADPINGDNLYTFNFEGNSQALDHVFVTDSLVRRARLDIVHVNVDYPNLDEPAVSDHEPLVSRLRLLSR